MTSRTEPTLRERLERFDDWLLDQPTIVAMPFACFGFLAATMAVIFGGFTILYGIALVYRVSPLASAVVVAGLVWFAPVRFARWAWRESQKDLGL